MSIMQIDEARQQLVSFKQQSIPQTEKEACQYFAAYTRVLKAMLQSNFQSKSEIAAEIKDMTGKIISTHLPPTTERTLELYMIAVENNLPELLSDRFLAGKLWS